MRIIVQQISALVIAMLSCVVLNAQTMSVRIWESGNYGTIDNGGTYSTTGTNQGGLSFSMTIVNTSSTTALTLTKNGSGKYITLSGVGASDFVVDESKLTGTVAPNSFQTFELSLSSSPTNGSRKVTMGISTNDNQNAPFTGSITYKLALPVKPVTSITKASDIGLSLYPNPSSDGHLFITADNIAVEKVVVSNVSGVTQEFAAKEFTTSLTGLLLVKIYTDKGIVSEKVIIQE